MERYGAPAALVINRIMVSINSHIANADKYQGEYFRDDRWWMADTYEAISKFFRGSISAVTVKRCILQFEKDGLLVSRPMKESTGNMTKWYSVNVAVWEQYHNTRHAPLDQNDPIPHEIKMTRPSDQIDPTHEIKMIHSLSKSLPNSHTESLSLTGPMGTPPQPSAGGTILTVARPAKAKGTTAEDEELAAAWLAYSLNAMGYTSRRGWSVDAFAGGIAKIKRVMGYSHRAVQEVFQFVSTDEFWAKTVQSPCALLGQSKNGLRKIENIVNSMKGSKRYASHVANDTADRLEAEMMAYAKAKGIK